MKNKQELANGIAEAGAPGLDTLFEAMPAAVWAMLDTDRRRHDDYVYARRANGGMPNDPGLLYNNIRLLKENRHALGKISVPHEAILSKYIPFERDPVWGHLSWPTLEACQARWKTIESGLEAAVASPIGYKPLHQERAA